MSHVHDRWLAFRKEVNDRCAQLSTLRDRMAYESGVVRSMKARKFPLRAIAEILGWPREKVRQRFNWSDGRAFDEVSKKEANDEVSKGT